MPDCHHSLLIDLLAAHGAAADFGCGLEPRLLELLLDRHARPPGLYRLDRPVRTDGPAQVVPDDWPWIGPGVLSMPRASHVRR